MFRSILFSFLASVIFLGCGDSDLDIRVRYDEIHGLRQGVRKGMQDVARKFTPANLGQETPHGSAGRLFRFVYKQFIDAGVHADDRKLPEMQRRRETTAAVHAGPVPLVRVVVEALIDEMRQPVLCCSFTRPPMRTQLLVPGVLSEQPYRIHGPGIKSNRGTDRLRCR